MVYKGFYFNIIIRVILIFLSSFWLSFCLHEPEKIYTIITVSSITILQIVFLINYINKTNRDLARFFSSLKDKDSSTHINFDSTKGAFKELSNVLNDISELIGKSRIETEKNSKYFEFVVEHIPIGLITINNTGKIIHSNKAFCNLLNLESIKSIDKIKSINYELGSEIENIKPGEPKIYKLKINNQFLQLLIRSIRFSFNDEELNLISVQDVKNELEENELISWQKLIRVLTHEIMNSITPISTLTLATKKCLSIDNKARTSDQISNDTILDALTNIMLIEDRSIGLQNFVEKYRSLTKIQALKTSNFNVLELLERTLSLFKDEIQNKKIEMEISCIPQNILLEADEKLIEQVLINLLKNSIESLESSTKKSISMNSYTNSNNRIEIAISDCGGGISDEIIDQIFMPFYSTKEQGSGIGLSLARQIMRLHGGSISVQSIPKQATTFILTF
jgi:nitrogen fixation/metabolism regulation signal transduction histidine kinase